MARKETYTVNLAHSGCAQSGDATIEEDENPVYAKTLHREIRSVPKGFSNRDSEIFCDACGSSIFRAK